MDSPKNFSDKPDRKESHKSNYVECYKNNYRTLELTMQQRRETFLNEHKEKHSLVFDEKRDLSELFEEHDCEDDGGELMEIDRVRKQKVIKFKMTMSEWFTQIPEDLSENWVLKFCPAGKRRLVISAKGKTKCFNKFGYKLFECDSSLPGGGTRKSRKEGVTVLDCIFNSEAETFFILDMLVWNSVSFLDCEAELRLSWIRSKYEEFPELFSAYGKGSFKFEVLFYHPSDIETIKSEMWKYDSQNGVHCDGLIFYHKEAPYICGRTPLVTWLKPFMLPEKLNITIPYNYENRRPPSYVNLETHIIKVNKRKKDKRIDQEMESEEIPME